MPDRTLVLTEAEFKAVKDAMNVLVVALNYNHYRQYVDRIIDKALTLHPTVQVRRYGELTTVFRMAVLGDVRYQYWTGDPDRIRGIIFDKVFYLHGAEARKDFCVIAKHARNYLKGHNPDLVIEWDEV